MENGILSPTEITNGTELIAKFKGFAYNEKNNAFYREGEIFELHLRPEFEKRFFDYELLMNMIDDISKLKIDGYTPFFTITNFGSSIEINKHKIVGKGGHNLLTNLWILVVEFLVWYYTKNI